jgi:uncharacterized membrane protein YcjF (UPF0283 family)
MTIRVPSFVLGLLAFVIATVAISFGVAFAVNEWRASGYIDCVANVQDAALDQWEQHAAERPVSPQAPGAGASSAAIDTYGQQFSQYQAEWDSWQKRGDLINQEWIDQTRACH